MLSGDGDYLANLLFIHNTIDKSEYLLSKVNVLYGYITMFRKVKYALKWETTSMVIVNTRGEKIFHM